MHEAFSSFPYRARTFSWLHRILISSSTKALGTSCAVLAASEAAYYILHPENATLAFPRCIVWGIASQLPQYLHHSIPRAASAFWNSPLDVLLWIFDVARLQMQSTSHSGSEEQRMKADSQVQKRGKAGKPRFKLRCHIASKIKHNWN